MAKGNRLSLLLILLLFTGCFSKPIGPDQSTANKILIIENIGTPTPDITSTRPAPTITLTATPASNFTRRCLQVEPKDMVLKDVISGTVLLFPDLFEIQSGKKYELPAKQARSGFYGDGNVSLDGKLYAYTEDILNNQSEIISYVLWVVNARAEVLTKISFGQYLGAPRWLDNNHLIMETDKFGTLLVVNPFTREQQIVSNELPSLDTFPFPGGPWWRVEYSPDLEWVAYYYVNNGNRGTIVRDVLTKQNLWQSMSADEGKPAWSPDGQEVAVVGEGQLYLVNRSGQAKPILNDELIHKAQSPSWSPDNQQVAFWNNDSLVIYNMQTNQAVDLCIPGDGEIPLPSALWSPDSQQIIASHKILVDLQRKTAYKLKEIPNATITDWMNSLP